MEKQNRKREVKIKGKKKREQSIVKGREPSAFEESSVLGR